MLRITKNVKFMYFFPQLRLLKYEKYIKHLLSVFVILNVPTIQSFNQIF